MRIDHALAEQRAGDRPLAVITDMDNTILHALSYWGYLINEGKDFFDGDSKLATKNIPADAVDKVEVLRNYNEVDQMRGLGNDQDNIAINIKLKEGKKNFWFGEITAGGGIAEEKGKYLIHPKLFYYSPKYSINFITDFNDIGEVPFTWRDYFKFTGGFRNFNRGGGTNFSISQSDLGFALTQNNRANEIETKFFVILKTLRRC